MHSPTVCPLADPSSLLFSPFPQAQWLTFLERSLSGRDLRQAFPGAISFGRILEGGPVSIPLYRGDAQGTEVLRNCSKVTLRTLARPPEP